MYPDILIIRQLGLQPWALVSLTMHQFTNQRHENTPDEIWLVEHEPVFTQGQAGKSEHLLTPGEIPVMQSDRGGQVTYHGPGQQIMYVLVNLRRRRVGVRQLVSVIEQTVIDTLSELSVISNTRLGAPGVYVNDKKICSLGLRIHNGCSSHGLALNVAMDLSPFLCINPCGYVGLEMTQLTVYRPLIKLADIQPLLIKYFARQLAISNIIWSTSGVTVSK